MALALSWWKRARGAFSRQERAQSTATSEELRLDPLSVGLPNVESPNIGPPNVGPLNVVPSNFDPSNGAELRPGLTANEVLDKDGSSISVLRRLLHRSWFSPHSRTLAWETLTRGLEVLKDATPFCPPVQSVAGGLLQLIYQCDAIAHNPAERRKLYACVNTIKDHLDVARRSLDRHPITESGQAVKASVEAFDSVLQDVLRDAKAQALGSQGRFKRFKRHAQVFILARFHKAQISDLLSRLFEADAHLRVRALLSLVNIFCTLITLDRGHSRSIPTTPSTSSNSALTIWPPRWTL
ncbi:hypothetical protein PENSPDRAFT_434569 [Peniophora sp. CONT]|nr:hypothetical protein PENSPDRAFT_434569 [Peniophora sp. CONT]